MLTGDKQNTAIQIGLLCNLITLGIVLSSEIDYPVNLAMQMFRELVSLERKKKELIFHSTVLFSKIKIYRFALPVNCCIFIRVQWSIVVYQRKNRR